jgi:hypothetical protein
LRFQDFIQGEGAVFAAAPRNKHVFHLLVTFSFLPGLIFYESNRNATFSLTDSTRQIPYTLEVCF